MSQTSTPRCPFEHIQNPDLEAQQIEETTKLTVKLLDKRYPPPNEILRGVHPKSHGCVKATFTVNPDIAPEFQVGIFSEPGKQFDAFIRFSNAAVLVGADTKIKIDPVTKEETKEHGSRGMAIKVLDVGGEVLIEDNGARNQDFLMINQPKFAFANTEDYLRLDRVLDRDADVATGFFSPLFTPDPSVTPKQQERIKESFKIVTEDIQKKSDVGNPLGIPYYSAAPFLFGPDRVMKFSAMPCTEVPPIKSPPEPSPDYLREALTETMNKNEDLNFDFKLQVRREGDDFGVENEYIENASLEWDEAKYPFVKVAKINIPAPQPEVDSDENKAHCEKLAFTPWHSRVEHQPIGSINRLRKSVYQASAEHRLKQQESVTVGLWGRVSKLFFS